MPIANSEVLQQPSTNIDFTGNNLHHMYTKCDVSVSRLPGLETFANFLVVSVSVSENFVSLLVSEKSLCIGINKFGLVRKVSVSVLENLVSKKSLTIGLRKFGLGKKVTNKKWPKEAISCL